MRDWLDSALPVIIFGLTLLSLGCDKDVTSDAQYRFSRVVGTWKTKTPLTLWNDEGNLCLETEDGFVGQVVAKLPAGTVIRVQHLIRYATEAGYFMRVTGTITSGQYAGKEVRI